MSYVHKEETAISSEEPADVTALYKAEADKREAVKGKEVMAVGHPLNENKTK